MQFTEVQQMPLSISIQVINICSTFQFLSFLPSSTPSLPFFSIKTNAVMNILELSLIISLG